MDRVVLSRNVVELILRGKLWQHFCLEDSLSFSSILFKTNYFPSWGSSIYGLRSTSGGRTIACFDLMLWVVWQYNLLFHRTKLCRVLILIFLHFRKHSNWCLWISWEFAAAWLILTCMIDKTFRFHCSHRHIQIKPPPQIQYRCISFIVAVYHRYRQWRGRAVAGI